jgi:Zn-finger nucleic acid-binding protein
MVAEQSTYVENYLLLGVFVVAMITVIIFHRHEHETPSRPGAGEKASPRYTLSLGGGDGGLYWSGAMRCPKCRSDMDQINHEGIEVDRCSLCNGIWFDAGEIELLKNKHIARAIDVGDSKTGKQANAIRSYQCPRCSGDMISMVDSRQRHIRYETCNACAGSFLDAGEFRDLASLTLSDFFKR